MSVPRAEFVPNPRAAFSVLWLIAASVAIACSSNGSVSGTRSDAGAEEEKDASADATADATEDAPTQEGGADADASSGTHCDLPPNADISRVDFRSEPELSPFLTGERWVRTVYASSAPNYMTPTPDGMQLQYDADQGSGYLDSPYRAEFRETSDGPPLEGTTHVYRIQFSVLEMPSTLYGPLVIFQRFSDGQDKPDFDIELSSVHQFPSTAAPNSIQIVDLFGRVERQRFVDTYLQPKNELLVAIKTAAVGKYVVVLNGEKLVEWNDVDTRTVGPTWLQFGIYWHGVIRDEYAQRAEQVASGETVVTLMEHLLEKYEYHDDIDFAELPTYDPNTDGYRCHP